MKEASDSEYAISQKLDYEKGARRYLEVEFEVTLKSLQNDQVTIARYEVELNDLKGTANYAMDCITVSDEGEQSESVLDRLINTLNKLLTLLKATSLVATMDVLVRVKSHYSDSEKDLAALELEVRDAALELFDSLDYEGDDGEE
jgi:hypothetical protein